MNMTGAQLRTLLEQQWGPGPVAGTRPRTVLQVSKGFSYQWRQQAPLGKHVVPGSVKLNGVPIDDAKTYRIAANNFLAEGGDGFPLFATIAGKRDTQIRDLDALTTYLARSAAAGKPAGSATSARRIVRAD